MGVSKKKIRIGANTTVATLIKRVRKHYKGIPLSKVRIFTSNTDLSDQYGDFSDILLEARIR